MSKDTKALKIAKGLLLLSLNTEGKADQERVKEIISELRKEGISKSIPILQHYLTLMKRKINSMFFLLFKQVKSVFIICLILLLTIRVY